MDIGKEITKKSNNLKHMIKSISNKVKWYKRNPKALLITLSILLLIELMKEFCMAQFFLYEFPFLFSILLLILYPFASISYLIEVFVLYWLIEYFTSKIHMHPIVRWLMNTVLLISISNFFYTMIISSQSPEYFTSGKILNLIYMELFINYRNLPHVFSSAGWIPDDFYSLYSIGTLWPHFTLIVPFFGFLGELKARKKQVTQVMVDQENQERMDHLDEQKRKKTHKREKIKFTWRRLILKLVMAIGYIIVYLGILLCLLPVMSIVDTFSKNVVFVKNYIGGIVVFLFGVILYFIGSLVLKYTKKKLDLAYLTSSMKFHWRMNFLVAFACVFLFFSRFLIDRYSISSVSVVVLRTSMIWFVLIFINSLRLRIKWKRLIKKTEAEITQNLNGISPISPSDPKEIDV